MTRTRAIPRWGVLAVAVALMLARASAAWAAPADKREMRAREAYAAGQYQEALDLYVKLYAEKLHPTYLRNIGRCYQLLGDPDKAINSFHEYLHKAKGLSSSEKAEVEGYIHDMEGLKAQKGDKPGEPARQFKTAPPVTASGTPPSSATPSSAAPPSAAPSSAAPPPAAAPPAATPVLVAQPGGATKEEPSSPVYTRWWFWTIIGGVAAAGAIAFAAGAFKTTKDAACDPTRSCM